jgi:hypothetical protein
VLRAAADKTDDDDADDVDLVIEALEEEGDD